MQRNPRKRIVFASVGGLVEPGIFMSNGRAEPENGNGESGKGERVEKWRENGSAGLT